MDKKHEPLVFEIVGGTGFVVMTRRDDNSGRAYQGADGRTYRDDVKLKFEQEGATLTVEVHAADHHVATFHIPKGDYDKTYSWLQTDTRLKLLPRRSYNLEFSGLVATVTRK